MGSYNIVVIWGMWIKETPKLHAIYFMIMKLCNDLPIATITLISPGKIFHKIYLKFLKESVLVIKKSSVMWNYSISEDNI